MFDRLRNEPALLGSLVEAVIALAFAFGWIDWTGEQVGAVMAIVALLTGVSVRQAAWGPRSVDRIMDADAYIRRHEGRG